MNYPASKPHETANAGRLTITCHGTSVPAAYCVFVVPCYR